MKSLIAKIFFLKIVCCLWGIACLAQPNFNGDPKRYYTSNKEIAWQDYFYNDQSGWLEDLDSLSPTDCSLSGAIADGCLEVRNTDPERICALGVDPGIDFSKDYEIEYAFRIVSVPRKREVAAVLYWSRDSIDRSYYLYSSKNGSIDYLALDASSNGKVNRRHYYFPSKKDDFTKINIRKVGTTIYLFVNERFRCTFTYIPITGALIGLGAGPGAEVRYDYVRVFYLKPV